MPPLSIYIHWPFCEKKCPYCDFFSQVKTADQDAVIKEYLEDLDFYHQITTNHQVQSIFFGGGTPSLIKPENIEKIINHINKKWPAADNLEISLEANPNSLNAKDLKQAGINRLSLGVQALNDKDLEFLGRIHDKKQALKAINEVVNTFDNHSIDLIYARPAQTLQDWQEELKQAADFGLKHISLYQLTIEEGTPFYKQNIESLDEDCAAELYKFTEEFLNVKGYKKYEVSNFSQPNFESRHNLAYWRGEDYLGIGKSAAGRIGLTASTHHRKLEKLTKKERAAELLLMGLRIIEGINKEKFFQTCGVRLNYFINKEKLEELKALNLIEETPTTLKTTSKGFPVLNKIIEELYK